MAWRRTNTLAINTELMWNPQFLENIRVTPSNVQNKMMRVLEKCENYIKESGHPLNLKNGAAVVTGYSGPSYYRTPNCCLCGGTYSNTHFQFSDEKNVVYIDNYTIHWIQKHVPAGTSFPPLYDNKETLEKLDSILNQLLF